MLREIIAVDDKQLKLVCCHEIALKGSVGENINCPLCDELQFPEGMECYKKTAEFTDETVPNGLRKDHHARRGVWARIVVSEGRMKYIINDPLPREFILDGRHDGIIPPELSHFVETPEVCRFQVHFYREITREDAPEVPSTALD